jgi:hypothetical protein
MEPEESQTVIETVDLIEVNNQAKQTSISIINTPSIPNKKLYF